MALLLALDQGTTSSRALVFDEQGEIVALAQQEFQQHYPHAGWVEHDPHAIIDTQFEVAREALSSLNVDGSAVAAIGITNQRETCLLWERSSGTACTPALVWQDRRTAGLCEAMRARGVEQQVREKTGLLIDPYFSASKIHWLLAQDPALRRRAEAGELAFGTIDSWLLWHLSDGRCHATDATNASRTLLYDIHAGDWDDELLALWQIPRTLLPQVVDSSGVCANTTRFGGDVPIAGIAGDQQAALFGQACFSQGMAKCTYGTGCFVLMHTGNTAAPADHGLLATIASRIAGHTEYALEGSVFMGGATVQWLRDGLGMISRASEIEALAASVPDSDGVVLVPAFTGLGAPHWDAHARALLIGMTRGTQRGHIARAALDGIAWQVHDVVAAMASSAGTAAGELRVDGAASTNDLLMQLQSDYLDAPLLRPAVSESTAYGAALLAGLGVGVYADRASISAAWRSTRRFEPALPPATRTRLQQQWRRALERCRDWAVEP